MKTADHSVYHDSNAPSLLRWTATLTLCLALAALGTTSCSLTRLSEDLEETEAFGLAYGQVIPPAETDDQVLVLLYRKNAEGMQLDKVDEVGQAIDRYAFPADSRCEYRIVAFQDLDGDLMRDAGEPAGTLGSPVTIEPNQKLELEPLTLDPEARLPEDLPLDLRGRDLASLESMPFVAGEVMPLDSERFSREEASAGMWQPMTTALEYGAGVYFLEEYDPARIPVLFVHGVGGSPSDFSYLIENLDRDRYQVWYYHYPSGARLFTLAAVLKGLIRGLHEELGFDTLYVTAHSMGGLVARSFILQTGGEGNQDFIKLYVSFSSPYNGHEGAAKGVEYLPVAVPCWIDMQPDSAFLLSLRQPLPGHIPFYLFFGHDSEGFNPGVDSSSDGVISLRSQLAPFAQEEAVRTWGYDLAHVPILHDPEPFGRYVKILDRRTEELAN